MLPNYFLSNFKIRRDVTSGRLRTALRETIKHAWFAKILKIARHFNGFSPEVRKWYDITFNLEVGQSVVVVPIIGFDKHNIILKYHRHSRWLFWLVRLFFIGSRNHNPRQGYAWRGLCCPCAVDLGYVRLNWRRMKWIKRQIAKNYN